MSEETESYRLPSGKALTQASRIACVEDKPIMMDYWVDSCIKKASIGGRDDGEKLLVRNSEEYTSPIVKIYKPDDGEYIVMTENSIYIVSSEIPTVRIS